MKKNKKIERSVTQEEDSFQAAEDQWQEEFEAEMTFREELLRKGAKLERERIALKVKKYLPEIAKFLNETNQNVEKVNLNESFTLIGINIYKLVKDLENRKFFDSVYKKDILGWFYGTLPEKPIPMNVSATSFVSIIADLMDTRPKYLKNSKKFIYKFIQRSFLFNGKIIELSSIKQIMKPGENKNRVSSVTKTIPNIQDFKK